MKIIRTKTKVLGGITSEEKIKLDAHTEKWIANAMSTAPVDPAKLTLAIKSLYAAANLKEPRIVIAPSPLAMAMAGGFAAAIWWARKNNAKALKGRLAFNAYSATASATDSATASATRNATDSATYSATYSATASATYSATRNATDSATDSATASATYSATRNATDSATYSATASATDNFAILAKSLGEEFGVDHAFMLRCAQNWQTMYQGGNMWSAWVCYLSAYRDVLGLTLPGHEKYKAWESCAIEGGFRVVHEEFCIVSDRPEILKVDNENRPHCENGPSHRWRDGWSLYHWHGVVVPGEWVFGKPPSAKDALTWANVEQRRAACEIVGWAKILDELGAVVIDEDGDEEIGTLLEVDLPDAGKERFLKVLCGTGRAFALPVPREMKSAIQANAWTYGLNPNDFSPEVRT